MMGLQEEIEKQSKEIHTDAYSMSIGELVSMYEAGELDIHPEFQRFFRWRDEQKSRLIESILLGIPLPSIFVAQRDDGVWDVIDGLQRLSTVFELIGILKDEVGNKRNPLRLLSTKYLPSLADKEWDSGKKGRSLSLAQRLYIKRAKIDVKIIKKESSRSSKYELFQRLNTGGSPLTDQEVRNCVLISLSRNDYDWLREMSQLEDFQNCVAVSDRAREEQYDVELALRFVVLWKEDVRKVRQIGDIGEYLTEVLVHRATKGSLQSEETSLAFTTTFRLLANALGSDSFRRYSTERDRFQGGFLISAFEAIGLGLGFNSKSWNDGSDDVNDQILSKVKATWENRTFLNGIGSGRRASQRMPITIPFGREQMKP